MWPSILIGAAYLAACVIKEKLEKRQERKEFENLPVGPETPVDDK